MEIRSHIDRYSPLNWSLKYRMIAFLTLALVLMPIVLVAANDVFSDVPSSSPFHDDISAIYGARITNGTSPGIYSPGQFVTREQMAIFLHRALPRVAYNISNLIPLSENLQDEAVVTITTGGAVGGTGFVKLDASVLAFTADTTGCPCQVHFNLAQDGGVSSSFMFVTVYNRSGGVSGNASGSLTWAVPVPTASTQTFRLKVARAGGTAAVMSNGILTALYVPFGATGGNTLNPPAMGVQAVSDAQEAQANKSN